MLLRILGKVVWTSPTESLHSKICKLIFWPSSSATQFKSFGFKNIAAYVNTTNIDIKMRLEEWEIWRIKTVWKIILSGRKPPSKGVERDTKNSWMRVEIFNNFPIQLITTLHHVCLIDLKYTHKSSWLFT